MSGFNDLGWAPALIICLGAFLIGCGIIAILTEWVLKYRQAQRRNKRLYGQGNVYSTRDFKP